MAPTALAWTKLATLTVLTCAQRHRASLSTNIPCIQHWRRTANDVAKKCAALRLASQCARSATTVKGGDTPWSISKLFLSHLALARAVGHGADIKNRITHLPRPGPGAGHQGQCCHCGRGADTRPLTVRVSPRIFASAADSALPPEQPFHRTFLAEPLVVGENELKAACASSAREGRVFLANGDRAYARGSDDFP